MKTVKDLEKIEKEINALFQELDKLHRKAKRKAIKKAEKEGTIITYYCFDDKERKKEMDIKERISILRNKREEVFRELKEIGVIPRRGFLPLK